MKTGDFIFRIPSEFRDSLCRIRLFKLGQDKWVALLTDVGRKNTGQSVTNNVEHIRQKLIAEGYIDDRSLIIEHYERNDLTRFSPTYDIVTFDKKGRPQWQPIKLQEAVQICDSTQQEIESNLSDKGALMKDLDFKRLQIWPEMDLPSKESKIVIKRRQDIARSMISKDAILNLVAEGATEAQIQTLLKNDLSVFGEIYAQPTEEYISFSEFPIGSGRADFVVFTGTSRMDVIVVEVKGADFTFSNNDSYGNFSSKINEAAQQLRQKINHIRSGYEHFRVFAHDIRAKVEKGKNIYNSLCGPKGLLAVDPNKDIYISGIVIGGRCRDNLYESKIRHQYEVMSNPRIRIESWDSWLKKLTR